MANDLEFTISAKDQASRAVETVQKKLKNFGSDLAKMALGFAAPLALAQMAFSAIGDAIEEHKKKVQEAIDNTAELSNKATDLGVSVEVYQKLSSAADAAGMSIDKVGKAYTEIQKLLAGAVGGGNDTAKMLEVLGFAADDIANGLVQPMDVIEKLGAAMLGAKDDTTAMKIATAVLGETLAKDLLPQLKAAMDLAGGFGEEAGISKEEAELIRQKKIKEKQTKNREEAQIAKQEAAKEFLTSDPEGQKIIARKQAEAARAANAGGAAVVLGTETIAGMKDVQDEVMRILKARAAAEKERLRIANEAKANEIIVAAEALAAEKEAQDRADKAIEEAMTQAEKDAKKAEEDKRKAGEKSKDDAAKASQKEADEAKKAADDKAKKDKDELGKALDAEEKARKTPEKLTLSSLREIGGAISGEAFSPVDYQKETLDIQAKILVELERLNLKTLPEAPTSVDFTKQSIA
jgi:hypothetical protein